MEKKLAKIEHVSFGFGGYQEAAFGLTLTFTGDGWGIGHFISGGWSFSPSETASWTENDRAIHQADMCKKIIEILKKAKVKDVAKLKGIPVEVTIEGNTFKDFRILTEVL
jgi:hypothetical protein